MSFMKGNENAIINSNGKNVNIWDKRKLEKVMTSFKSSSVSRFITSHKENKIVVCSDEGQVELFDDSGKILNSFQPHGNFSVTSLVPLEKENFFVSSSTDSTLKLSKFNEESGFSKVLHTFKSHSLPVFGVKINSGFGDNRLLSFGKENSCKTWKFTSHLKETPLHEFLLDDL